MLTSKVITTISKCIENAELELISIVKKSRVAKNKSNRIKIRISNLKTLENQIVMQVLVCNVDYKDESR